MEKTAFFKDGIVPVKIITLKIIGHIQSGTKIGVDKFGRIYRYCEPNMSASEYNPELDGPIRFDV